MKKNLFLALTLLVSVLLVACSNGNEDSTAVNDWQATGLSWQTLKLKFWPARKFPITSYIKKS